MKYYMLSFALLLCSTLVCKAQNPSTEKEIAAKIDKLIQQMTLEEKVGMLHGNSLFTSGGVKRLGIPDLSMSDGPHGVRLEHGPGYVRPKDLKDAGTYLPTGVCLAATWNPTLGYEFGAVLGSEASYRGKDVILGPGINIIRTVLNGRNFEYQSEDPFLISAMAVNYIKGVQDQGVSACVKHFMANNQELQRTSIDVQMSNRALNEIYLPGFKAAVTIGKVNTLMGAYNKFRGQWATQNDYLINQILKKDWGFKGIVISDWGAVHSTEQALWNGTDLEMGTDIGMRPNVNYAKFYLGDTVINLVKTGKMPEYLVNDKVRRILYVMFKTNMIDGKRKQGEYNTKSHQQTALKIAEEGIVLLKNQNKILPLTAGIKSIAVIGYNAARLQALGGGSSQVKAFYEVTPLEGLKNMAGKSVNITYTQGYKIERGAVSDANMIEEAAGAAAKADVAIIVGGWTHGYNYNEWKDNAYDAEDTDKPDMLMPFGQDELISAVLKANPKTVVVLMGGGPIDMSRWIDQTPAVIEAWYAGMEGGNALAKIIFGRVNPSGKLPMSFPKKLEDEPAHKLGEYPGNNVTVNYTDDIYVGYRYYDTFNVSPQFAFGHGLSYTTFKYSDLRITAVDKEKINVSFKIKNTGIVAGAETAQLYIKHEKSSLPRPEKELKGFRKLFLQAGEEQVVTLNLNKDAFQYFNDIKNQWVSEPGYFDFIVGASSKDIRLTGKILRQ